MKKIVIVLVAFSLIIVSADAKKKPKVVVPEIPVKVFTNNIDSMSYALGMSVGADFSKNIQAIPGGKSNIDLLIKGFSTAMKGDSALMTAEFANDYFRKYIASAQEKELAEKKLVEEKFLADNKTKAGVITTASGLQYQILVPSEGVKPKATDTVTVHYVGSFLDGKKFDSSIERGEPTSFPLNQVIPAWAEGVQLMSIGSKYKFYVPYQLGYGEQGAGNGAIPGFSTLVFEVELLDVKPFVEPMPEIVPEVKAPAKKSTSKPSVKKK